MALGKQIVEKGRILNKVILKILLEFIIVCIHNPVLYTNPSVFCSLNLFLGTILVDVTELKAVVAIPSFLREIATQEASLCIGIVVDLDDNFLVVVRVHTHRIAILFGISKIAASIEVPLTILKDSCIIGIGLLNKHNTGIECHGVAHLRIILLCLTNIRVELVKLICQQSVICILRRGNVDFDVKILFTNTIFCKCILATSAVVTKGKATRAININISARLTVCVRASALSFMGASSGPIVFHSAAILINVLDGRIWNFVLLAGRKGRSRNFDNAQVWAFFSQQVRVQFATHVRNVVAGIALNHFLCVLRIGNKVVEDLIIRQVHHVRLHAVNLHITIRRTNRDADRRSLCKIVACIV